MILITGIGLYIIGRYDGRSAMVAEIVKAEIEAINKREKSMQKLVALILVLSALSLVACSQTASNCAGWSRIGIKPETAVYLASNDRQAGQGIASHNAFGKKACGW